MKKIIIIFLILAPLISIAQGVEKAMGVVYGTLIILYNIPALGAFLFLIFSKGKYKKAIIFNGLIWAFYTALIINGWNSYTEDNFFDKTILNPFYGPITIIFALTIVLFAIERSDRYSE